MAVLYSDTYGTEPLIVNGSKGPLRVDNWYIALILDSLHSEKILKYYSCIGGCLVAQNTVAEIWSNAR